MTRAWLFVPWLALVALAASVWGWQTQKNAWQPPAARAPELPALAALPPVEPAAMTQATARPLLWAERRPVAQDAGKDEAKSELAQARLLAVVAAGKEQIALLTRQDGKALKLTSQTRPWRLESFDGRTAIFVSIADGKRIERALEQQAPPAQAPAAARAAPAAAPAKQR